ncbi:hypothetical protein GQ600_13536 [Phytophthora cactorum]|nr:hypothetical protein GQ600_13536 [Phytophthora cactorum]
MSDVVVPSFFPTPTEIAGGIRWVKQHPVVPQPLQQQPPP